MSFIDFNISLPQLQAFFLIFVRVAGILLSIPILSSTSIPPLFKISLALTASIVIFPMLDLPLLQWQENILTFGAGLTGEIMMGITIGFVVRIIFAGIQLAGQLVGYQMGLAIANVMDPDSTEQMPILAQLNNLIAVLVFLAINAHHWFLKAVVESYRLVPPLGVKMEGTVLSQLVYLSGDVFLIALKIGAPVIAALLLTSVAFGLVARTVPQMNVFIVAMPLKIGVGLLFFGLSLPYLEGFLRSLFGESEATVRSLLRAMAG
jgi:flagellar biosynthetic protein FliR